MKKLLFLIPVFAVILTGCNADMDAMSVAYDKFKHRMESNPYEMVETFDEEGTDRIVLTYNSATDYTLDVNVEGSEYQLICTGDESSTMKTSSEPDFTDATVNDVCVTLYDTMILDYTNNVENPMFFDSQYMVDYSATDSGFEAEGVYEDDSTNLMTINSTSTELHFEDSQGIISVTIK